MHTTCRDSIGSDVWYECISVIQHSGEISSDTSSRGHYSCDVKDKQTNNWFRTSDATIPHHICSQEVFKKGSAYLFKRKDM